MPKVQFGGRRFISFILAISLVSVFFISIALSFNSDKSVLFSVLNSPAISNTQTELFDALVQQAKRDLQVVASSDELTQFIKHQDESSYTKLAQVFTALVESRQYLQVRYLDRQGTEKLRVEYRDESTQQVAQKSLQNKAKRYYFRDTLQLAGNQYYVSPIDFNFENGEVETPYRPVIRVATPVLNEQSQKTGVLVINIDAQGLSLLMQKVK